jgi:hypothetical protein
VHYTGLVFSHLQSPAPVFVTVNSTFPIFQGKNVISVSKKYLLIFILRSCIYLNLRCAQFCVNDMIRKTVEPGNKLWLQNNICGKKSEIQRLRAAHNLWLYHSHLFNYLENCKTYGEILLEIKCVFCCSLQFALWWMFSDDNSSLTRHFLIKSRNSSCIVSGTGVPFQTNLEVPASTNSSH